MFLPRPLEGMLVGLVLFAMWYPFAFKKNKLHRNACIACLFVYIGAVVSLTMIYTPPSNWRLSEQSIRYALWMVNLRPFESSIEIFNNCKQMGDYSDFIRLVGGNTVMLLPLGILVPLLNRKFNWWRITLLGISVAFTIEFLQLGSNVLLNKILRTVEIDDFIQNSVGCIIGYILLCIGRWIYFVYKRRKYPPGTIGVITERK